MPELHQHNRYRQFKLPCRVGSQGSHTMNDSIELPALAMSIDEEVKAEASEAVDQTMVSVDFELNAFAAPLHQLSCHLPP